MKKLAIVVTHPIQYYAPVFRLLHERQCIEIKVFYTWGKDAADKYDPGFNKIIKWDIPLLDGYPYEWVINIASEPGSHKFKGIINPGLINSIEQWQADLVLVYGWAYHSHLKALRHFKNKIPVLFRGDSTLLDEQSTIKNKLKTFLLKLVYRNTDQALYVGTNNKAYFEKHGLRENQLIFAPHAVENTRFAADRKAEADLLREKIHVGSSEILIIFAGKLEEKKAPMLLLRAFGALDLPNAHLLFIGNGALENQLKNEATKFMNVHFLDFQNQSIMPVIYQACDLFCLPSAGPGETWGLAVNEAMACGKAILVSDKVGCAVDLIEENGAVFQAASLADLIRKLNLLVSGGKNALAVMGKRSKEIIKTWSFTRQAETLEMTVRNLYK